jgi:anti-sigma B factor antagonist
MTINKKTDGKTLTVTVSGRLDTSTAPSLEAELKDSLGNISELVFDMKEVEYVSSAGLRVLLSAQKTMDKQGSMKLLHVSDPVMDVFDVTGFTDLLTIE